MTTTDQNLNQPQSDIRKEDKEEEEEAYETANRNMR